jgi:5-(carboxyamino)imidazole ribonucleotide synthase
VTAAPDAPVVAVIGGGQLARMTAHAALALGIPLRLLAEAEGVSAAQVVPDTVVGDYRDLAVLRRVTEGCAVVTFDHEHVPTEHLEALVADAVPCRPGPAALVHAQDKGVMRERLDALGVPCPRHRVVGTPEEVAAFAAETGGPVVLKTTRGGYDGKGVWVVRDPAESRTAFETAARTGARVLAEELVDFRRELAALVVRSPSGQVAA